MSSLPSLRLCPREGVWRCIRKHLNFFRIHIIFLWVQIAFLYSTWTHPSIAHLHHLYSRGYSTPAINNTRYHSSMLSSTVSARWLYVGWRPWTWVHWPDGSKAYSLSRCAWEVRCVFQKMYAYPGSLHRLTACTKGRRVVGYGLHQEVSDRPPVFPCRIHSDIYKDITLPRSLSTS